MVKGFYLYNLFLNGFHKNRDKGYKIFNHTNIGHLENGSIRITIDGDNELGIPYPLKMLSGPGDAAGQVKGRCDGAARLSDLQ